MPKKKTSQFKGQEDKMIKSDRLQSFTYPQEGVTITASSKSEADKQLKKRIKK